MKGRLGGPEAWDDTVLLKLSMFQKIEETKKTFKKLEKNFKKFQTELSNFQT